VFWPTEAIRREITDKRDIFLIQNVTVDVNKQNKVVKTQIKYKCYKYNRYCTFIFFTSGSVYVKFANKETKKKSTVCKQTSI